ncbi:MAG: BON domain-containing protein [Sterolibacteriaceae bacterium MAG5]|nr:BON domain-containing protein [Candidatus Nitricoxidireducens bremensis]
MKAIVKSLLCAAGLAVAAQAAAFDPITSAISKGVATALDVRSKDDVKADVEIDASITKKLLDQKGDDFKDVSLLVFARHGVLVGYAKSEEVRRRAEELAKADKRLRSLKNDILVGAAAGGTAGNLLLDKKIDLALTAAKGVSSVNMRWKVHGGQVFLMGVAASKAEADLAVKKIKGLDGVKNVRSSLRVGRK